jgi:DNA-binding XRE family transcriptional regulator
MSVKKFLKLEYYRKKYGFKPEDMAAVIGKCLSSYVRKESGLTPFYDDEMVKIRFAINEKAMECGDPAVTLDEIFLTT